ncbi:MAG: hypothetical protein KAH86_00705, partial [Methanosarcinales archaeon]|nr:hypothetical protein [Methanosarcinales archaeon]
ARCVEPYQLLIFGDTGIPTIIDKVLRRVIVDTLGKVKDDIHIILIIDDDGTKHEKLYQNLLDKLQIMIKDASSFNILPGIEENDNLFVLKHPRSRGVIKIKFATVPASLEIQIANKIIAEKYPRDNKFLDGGAKKALKLLLKNYYHSDEEMIRESSMLLIDENWVKDIRTFCSTH